MDIEINGYFSKLAVDKDKTALCFIVTDGEGFDAETFEELFAGIGINPHSVGREQVLISINTLED